MSRSRLAQLVARVGCLPSADQRAPAGCSLVVLTVFAEEGSDPFLVLIRVLPPVRVRAESASLVDSGWSGLLRSYRLRNIPSGSSRAVRRVEDPQRVMCPRVILSWSLEEFILDLLVVSLTEIGGRWWSCVVNCKHHVVRTGDPRAPTGV